jgi:hypothetical protein
MDGKILGVGIFFLTVFNTFCNTNIVGMETKELTILRVSTFISLVIACIAINSYLKAVVREIKK